MSLTIHHYQKKLSVFNILKYATWRHWQNKPIRLTMSLLVKNEQDLIAANIHYHAHVGVDQFIVMDNGSTDNTMDIVISLSNDYDIILIQNPVNQYKQSDWATYMAFLAREKYHSDWFIANDADEFWVPQSGQLKTELNHSKSVVLCNRFDMQLHQEVSEQSFYNRIWRTHHPILFSKQDMIDEAKLSMNLGKIKGKVMANLHGLIRSKSGNHQAYHFHQRKQYLSSNVCVYHYPIGSFEHFKWTIENRRQLIQQGFDRVTPNHRRWLALDTEQDLLTEYQQMQLSDPEIKVLEKFGVISQDTTAQVSISTALDKLPDTN